MDDNDIMLALLCGRRNRSQYGFSVCPAWAYNFKTKRCRKTKVSVNVPHGCSDWCASFEFRRSGIGLCILGQRPRIMLALGQHIFPGISRILLQSKIYCCDYYFRITLRLLRYYSALQKVELS